MYRKLLTFLVLLMAISLAGIVAYVSVSGLVKTFNVGSIGLSIFIAIEIGKIVLTSSLHTFKNKLKGFKVFNFLSVSPIKIIGNIMIVIAMLITSFGIYGFLSNGYKKSFNNLTVMEKRTDLLDEKSKLLEDDKELINQQIESKRQRIKDQSSIRDQQETRLDSLYARRWYTAARRTEQSIKDANDNITKLESEIDVLNSKLDLANDSLTSYSLQKIELQQNNDAATELGPLIYLSDVTGYSMDNVIKWFVLLIVVIGDPMAVLLIIIFNRIIEKEQKKIDLKKIEEKVDEVLEEEWDEDHAHDMVMNEMVSDMDIEDFEPIKGVSDRYSKETKEPVGPYIHGDSLGTMVPDIKDGLGDDYEKEKQEALKKLENHIGQDHLYVPNGHSLTTEDFKNTDYTPLDEFINTPPPPKPVEPKRMDLTVKKGEFEGDEMDLVEESDIYTENPNQFVENFTKFMEKGDLKKNLSDGIYHSLLEESDFDEEFLFNVPSKGETKKETKKEGLVEDKPKEIKKQAVRNNRRKPGNGYMGIRRV